MGVGGGLAIREKEKKKPFTYTQESASSQFKAKTILSGNSVNEIS